MIFNRTTVQTNPEGEEYPEDGLELFDLAANRGDVRRFVGGCISFHWHTELEYFVLYEGQVQVSAGAQTCVLQAGEGCFINAGVLHSFQAQGVPPAAGQVQQARLKQILGWIDRHLENPITLRDLAGCAGVSPRECQRMFRRYLHCRPMEYLCQRRLLVAAEQLAATSFSVAEIALQCGFSSPSYFSKQFKRLVGQTPAAYRAGQRQP